MAKLHFYVKGVKDPLKKADGGGDLPKRVNESFKVKVTDGKLGSAHDYMVTQGQGVPGTDACRCTVGAEKNGTADCTRTA